MPDRGGKLEFPEDLACSTPRHDVIDNAVIHGLPEHSLLLRSALHTARVQRDCEPGRVAIHDACNPSMESGSAMAFTSMPNCAYAAEAPQQALPDEGLTAWSTACSDTEGWECSDYMTCLTR
jgi:hypothetical protein